MPPSSRAPGPASPDSPPETLEGLKQLLAAIDRREVEIRLGASSRRVLAVLIESPQRTAVSSISQLAELTGVNASTFSRLAQRLGYEGFSRFQDVFRQAVTDGEHFYSQQASQLLARDADSSAMAQLARLGRQESANILSMLERVDAAAFEAATTLLAEAPRVRLHGMRQFNSLALFMAYGLGMLRPDVAPLDASRQGVADALAQLSAGDVLVVASCFPYTPSVVACAEVAVKRGVEVIALTDSASSPLEPLARYSFHVPNHSLFYSNSMSAFMFLAEGLLSEVASKLGDAGVASLKQREAIITELGGARG
ncbi:MurR/RpiR family transcriptional regulator [Cobetia amphilecti]|uniref:MurR/RpiR family transcriptional regulator n=1 Tax=Cobetia amphilecti TaxID=1055104 RepID=A0ABT6UP49_9GAMM|nr:MULTISPECIES: MurR/RpiR family transcriptional regulator [Cobetia]AVV35142.1 RpiR family transcriptional regulator [Halomonas sp. SF2003]MBR9754320.1 MurR/RpiR family transcriptional regulator [Gammaproteobacteria bacterium]TCJ26548.1 MurR/RpiR family transcriptional regulator [Halomonas sp. GDM18]MCK8066824.1 MurR/RpiR family transcriptional regulator [Cobetia sp. 1CM21F]MDH2421664.1 MurR/RpiR family transcriptional regulator [Cobetia litoralis]